jgi:hypothetical protein
MLADRVTSPMAAGRLNPEFASRGVLLDRIVDFIADELPRWRDHPQRPSADAEKTLTHQLCIHLEHAARRSFDLIMFTHEPPDDAKSGRSLDLAVHLLEVKGQAYTSFEILLPIECKRLPTPKAARRDEREYVCSRLQTTGAIQRFKSGAHGSRHAQAVIIGYTQRGDADGWLSLINQWLDECGATQPLWQGEELVTVSALSQHGVYRYRSSHRRALPVSSPILIHHLWIMMMLSAAG